MELVGFEYCLVAYADNVLCIRITHWLQYFDWLTTYAHTENIHRTETWFSHQLALYYLLGTHTHTHMTRQCQGGHWWTATLDTLSHRRHRHRARWVSQRHAGRPNDRWACLHRSQWCGSMRMCLWKSPSTVSRWSNVSTCYLCDRYTATM